MKKIRVGILIVLLPTVMSAGLAASLVLNQAALAASASTASSDPQGTSCTGTGSRSDSASGSVGSAGKGFSGCAGGIIAVCGPEDETIAIYGGCSSTDPR
jgi:hypothetical protein